MPLSSSSNGRLLNQKPGKIKTILLSNGRSNFNKNFAEPIKNNLNNNGKSYNLNNQTNKNTAISSNLQHIVDHHRIFIINVPNIFNYDNASLRPIITLSERQAVSITTSPISRAYFQSLNQLHTKILYLVTL
jgi:hypothetical protein